MESDAATLEPLAQKAGHLWRVRQVVVSELSPDSRNGHQVRVRQVRVGVDREGDLPGAGQELVVEVLPGDADPVSVVRGKVAEISPVGHSPVRVLHVVTVTIVGSILPGLQIVR